jgi:hypothetical protein
MVIGTQSSLGLIFKSTNQGPEYYIRINYTISMSFVISVDFNLNN